LLFVGAAVGGLLLGFRAFERSYEGALRWCLAHKAAFLSVPLALTLLGAMAWRGADGVFGFLPEGVRASAPFAWARAAFPGLGQEFMPSLDEGSFLHMPTVMPHASIGSAAEILDQQVRAIQAIPEVETAVGKLGRVESALDPAPISMFETLVTYKPEYLTDENGRRLRFRYDADREEFPRDAEGSLIPDPEGRERGSRPYRAWRDEIRTPDDLWHAIAEAARVPGSTGAPKLQPIETRILMLQTGMRAPMAVKVLGDDLASVERAGLEIERFLKGAPGVEPTAVIADRIVGTPYLEIEIDRNAAARYGAPVTAVQDVIETALGGRRLTTTVEGRERYPVRVRYARELRDRADALGRVLVAAETGAQIPLEQLARIRYTPGPMMIRGEDTRLVGYVLFDKRPGLAEVDVVEDARRFLEAKVASGELALPEGVRYVFAGNYENQARAAKRLALVLPLALFAIFLVLYLQFRDVPTTLLVFTGIFVAWAGGFLMLWLYSKPWFLDLGLLGVNLREVFGVRPYNLSVAVWVGFLALFGIATDDGVIMATYLRQSFAGRPPRTRGEVREDTVRAGLRRVRPCLMTAGTTILALLPVLTSAGRGSDVMIPMAIPSFGGMTLVLITMFVVPTLYCWLEERKVARG
ncbi:MAG: efflux RND transporter permease subunit, partial [Candidatus Methylomirabilis sp.]|nr:efflux RND transporter permease subunit [Deltaproteobacteria bacterium]